LFGVLFKFPEAMFTAEIIVPAGIMVMVFGVPGYYHVTDRISVLIFFWV
jgi:hypothetical protein